MCNVDCYWAALFKYNFSIPQYACNQRLRHKATLMTEPHSTLMMMIDDDDEEEEEEEEVIMSWETAKTNLVIRLSWRKWSILLQCLYKKCKNKKYFTELLRKCICVLMHQFFLLSFQKFMCGFQYIKVLLFLYLKRIILPLWHNWMTALFKCVHACFKYFLFVFKNKKHILLKIKFLLGSV